mgnify:CR=1 FL=1
MAACSVAARWTAEGKGARGRGVAPTANHSPAHGAPAVDSHFGFPVITHSRELWSELDAVPFRAAIRAGIDSIHPDQRAAALAVGLTGHQSLRFVVLPQAVRRVVPPLLNDFISLQKDVALVSILGPLEAFRVGQIEAASNFIYTPLVAAGVLDLCVTIPLTRYLDRIQRRRRQRA